MITVACVLWQNVDSPYHPFHVNRLQKQVEPFAPEHKFVCLTNAPHWEQPKGIERIPLQEGWRGWWNKIELFRSGLFKGRVLYLDLDIEVVGDLTPIIEFSAKFASIKDYQNPKQINSSVMVWDAGAADRIFTEFDESVIERRHGDQGWISEVMDAETFPRGWCPSYKLQVRRFGCPQDAKVIVYHGQPKPWSIEAVEEREGLVRKGRLPA